MHAIHWVPAALVLGSEQNNVAIFVSLGCDFGINALLGQRRDRALRVEWDNVALGIRLDCILDIVLTGLKVRTLRVEWDDIALCIRLYCVLDIVLTSAEVGTLRGKWNDVALCVRLDCVLDIVLTLEYAEDATPATRSCQLTDAYTVGTIPRLT